MNHAIVILKDICKKFGEVIAVNHINLEIQRGEFVTLLGPSGCGKTTTLRIISGLETPDSGMVVLDEQNVTNTPPEKRPVNMVFQAYALFPHLTIAENIAFGPKIKHWSKSEIQKGIDEMLRLVQLEGYGDRKPSEISGGQAQRVALARALINRPKVLLLDEPLGALDLKLRQAMQLELRAIQKRLGMTFIYVTHDQEEAMVMSDRIVLINQGKIVQAGTPIEIYYSPTNEFVSRFIGEANLLRGQIKTSSTDHIEVDVDGFHVIAPPHAGLDAGQEVLLSIRPEHISIFQEASQAPSTCINVFPAKFKNAIFLGPSIRFMVCLANNQSLSISRTAMNGGIDYHTDQPIYIGWDAHSTVVLQA